MRVAYFLHTASATDGSSKAIIHLLEQVVKKGVEPLVILPEEGELCVRLQQMQVRYTVLQRHVRPSVYPWVKTWQDKVLFVPRLIGRWLVNSMATLESLRIIRDFQPEVIHSNSSVLAIGYYVAQWLNIPHVWHIREYGATDIHTYYYYPSLRRQKRRYTTPRSYTICITKDIERYNGLTGMVSSRTVYDGVLSESSVTYKPEKKDYFLYVGRLEPIKGILPLIDAYACYCKQHSNPMPLYIAGSGSDAYTRLVESKITEEGLHGHVLLLGLCDDVRTLYKEAKAVIVPSLNEGFGFVTAEAMFAGSLVIGHDVGGTKEQLDNGKAMTGDEIALRYTKQEELVKHMIDLTERPIAEYETMIMRGQQVVTQRYSTETHAQEVYAFYKDIVSHNI